LPGEEKMKTEKYYERLIKRYGTNQLLSCNANHPNDIVLTLQWQCSILVLL
jgi:hypothetical protein